MSDSCFVETTVLTDFLLKKDSSRDQARDALGRFGRRLVPEYAHKELKLGPLQAYFWICEKFQETGTFQGGIEALYRLSRTLQRNKLSTAIKAIADATAFAMRVGLSQEGKELDEAGDRRLAILYRVELQRTIINAWNGRHSVGELYDKLRCYANADISLVGDRVDLRPNNCATETSCGAQGCITKNVQDLKTVRKAVVAGEKKRENDRRSAILKRLSNRPNDPITKQECRWIGDAYFAVAAPKETVILTTNFKDIEPMATALGKKVSRP